MFSEYRMKKALVGILVRGVIKPRAGSDDILRRVVGHKNISEVQYDAQEQNK